MGPGAGLMGGGSFRQAGVEGCRSWCTHGGGRRCTGSPVAYNEQHRLVIDHNVEPIRADVLFPVLSER